jgi:hypothetical protein
MRNHAQWDEGSENQGPFGSGICISELVIGE